ncbi:MAG: radical SAM protein [Nitrospirales bacterium]
MKVVMLFPSWTGVYGGLIRYFAKRSSTWPPLNLALLAGIAERHGHEVEIIDGEVEGYSNEEIVKIALSRNPGLIAMTATSPFFHINKAVAELIKREAPHVPVAIGGPHITIMKEKAFVSSFDFGFVSEAEESWPQFLEAFEKGMDLSAIKGLLYWQHGQVKTTGQPEDIAEIDSLPFPSRHLLPMKQYRLGTLQGRKNFTSIQTMRGCPWKCIFCASEALKTTSMRVRSPQTVVAEMKSVVTQFGIRHFYIVDDVMTLWRDHIVEICDLIDREELKVTLEGSTRANLVDEKLIERLSKSGLIRLSFGLETVDSEMRKTMKKQVPLEHYVKANAICNRYGIEALNSVMIGLPGETRETVQKTLAFLGNSRDVKQANFAIAVPYPGTEFHEMAVNGNHGIELMTTDFSEYRRYGSAVTAINGLSPQDLIELQNEGFVRIYSAPWRWRPMLKKQGLFSGVLLLLRVLRLAFWKVFPRQDAWCSAGRISEKHIHTLPTEHPDDMSAARHNAGLEVASAFNVASNGPLIQIPKRKKPMVASGHYGSPGNPNG